MAEAAPMAAHVVADAEGETSAISLPSQSDENSDGFALSLDQDEELNLGEEPVAGGTDAEGEASAISEKSDDEELNLGEEPVAQEPVTAAAEVRDNEAVIFAGFSLESNGTRFRGPRSGKKVRVFEERFNTQLVLEDIDDGDDGKYRAELRENIQVSPALSLLRGVYSVIAVFMGGFLFILGFDILLFLFINLVTAFEDDNMQNIFTDFVASLLSVPVFVYSLAFIMTLVTNFVVDTFYGNPFLRSFGLGSVVTEWIAFVFFLCVPLLTFIITLFLGKQNWWEISLLTWFTSVMILWCFFSACVFYFEVTQCLELQRDWDGERVDIDQMGWREKTVYWLGIAKDATLNSMRVRLSGKESKYKKQKGDEKPEYEDRHNRCPVGLFSLITKKLPCYKQYDEEGEKKEILTVGEVLGLTSYITRYSWSLDKLFCRGRQTPAIFITSGESRVNRRQIQSSIACRIMGYLLIYLFVVALLTWLAGGLLTTTAKVLVFVLSFLVGVGYIVYNTYYLKGIFKDISDSSGVTWTRFWEVRRINEPSDKFIWFYVVGGFFLFYLIPLISICVQGNVFSSVLFAFWGLLSGTRHCLNGGILVRAYKHDFFAEKALGKREWKRKSRMYNMLNIGNTSRSFWITVFCVLVVFFNLVIVLYVRTQGASGFDSSGTTPMDGYEYRRNPYLPYPTCVLRVQENDLLDGDLVDWAYIAELAYSEPSDDESKLNTWFGDDVVRVNNTLKDEFRDGFDFEEYAITRDSPVSYKLVQSLQDPTYVMITIRGTATVADVMADAQLWISAMLFQGLRALLPLGSVFTPIIHHLVHFMNVLETDAIAEVAYYQETTAFAFWLRKRGYNVKVTGHSLGGGLALITGALAKVSSVGISAPNAMLSRDTFNISVSDLDTYTFNVVPNMDPVPKIDDKASLYQNIQCTAAANEIAACHDLVRTICELQYTCGSRVSAFPGVHRPVLCECVMDYNYTEPEPLNGTDTSTTFRDKCIAQQPCKWGDEKQKQSEECEA